MVNRGNMTCILRRAAMLLLSALLVLTAASCGRHTPVDEKNERPVISVGSSDYPPFIDLDNNGNPTGLDVDIFREAARRAGYDISFVTINWEERDDLLESGAIDCVTGGFTVEGRESDYLWVGPYVSSNQVVVVNSTGDIDSLEDLGGKSVAVQSASIAEEILLTRSNPSVPEDVQVYSYEDNSLPFAALGCDYIDALVADEPVVIQYMKDYDTVFTVLDEPLMYASVGTAFARDGDAELCAALNAAVDEMREDGTLDEIVSRYLSVPDTDSGGDGLEE